MLRIMAVATLSALCRDSVARCAFAPLGFCALDPFATCNQFIWSG